MSRILSGYTILATLGQGARSQVYRVLDPRDGAIYALKRVVRRGPEDDRFLEQTENEYAIASSVHHPVLRAGYQIKRTRKWLTVTELWLLLEFVDGKSLLDELPKGLRGFLSVFKQVTAGLHTMHECGFVHADIKPNNILVTAERKVKIIDFGQSCRIGHVKSRIQGTPDYIAPEQVKRLPLDPRTDVFNLGATMYWVLTGKPFPTSIPASATGRVAIPLAIPKGAVEPPHILKPEVPPVLSRLVMDCCCERPGDRPANMIQMASRLDIVLHLLDKETKGAGRPAKDRGLKGKKGHSNRVNSCATDKPL